MEPARRRQAGQEGEDLAAQYLLCEGFKILARNKSTRYGEIDIVATDGQELHFIEVRTRTHPNFGGAVESITFNKQKKLHATGMILLDQNPSWKKYSPYFSVIGIDNIPGKSPTLEFIRNAF